MGVVCGDDGIGEEEEGGTRVGDSRDGRGYGVAGADRVAGGGKAPKSLAVVDGGVGDVARVFGVVNVAKVVGAWFSLQKVGGEEGRVEEGFGVGKESLLLVRGDGVNGREGETEETVGFILSELRGDGFGEFDGLACDGCTAYVNSVGIDVTTGGASVAVADGPSFPRELFGSGGVGRIVDVMAGLFICGEFG